MKRSPHLFAGTLALLSIAGTARALTCVDVCSAYDRLCRVTRNREYVHCLIQCKGPACRHQCRRDHAQGFFGSGCRDTRETCLASCPSEGSSCGSECVPTARECLGQALHSVPECVKNCRSSSTVPSELRACKEGCRDSVDTNLQTCLRTAPLCYRAASDAYRACRHAAPSIEARRECRTQRIAARRECFAHPEGGLLGCTRQCVPSPTGAFLDPGDLDG